MEKRFAIRVATADPYCYLECTLEGEAVDAVQEYKAMQGALKFGNGLPDADWRRVLDNYLYGDETMKPEEYDAMNEVQVWCIQAIKKSKKRKHD